MSRYTPPTGNVQPSNDSPDPGRCHKPLEAPRPRNLTRQDKNSGDGPEAHATLNWLTRDEDIRAASRVPYRLLEEARDLSAGEADSGNTLIQGDNLEALKALLPFYAGQVKCIYIDPPYNTRSAFEHFRRQTWNIINGWR